MAGRKQGDAAGNRRGVGIAGAKISSQHIPARGVVQWGTMVSMAAHPLFSHSGPHRRPDGTAFDKALREIGKLFGGTDARGDFTDGASDAFATRMRSHVITLSPMTKCHVIEGEPSAYPKANRYGWAQLPQSGAHGFSIGMFIDRWHFLPCAFADSRGRVFPGMDPMPDIAHAVPALTFEKEQDQNVPVSWLAGSPREDDDMIAEAVVGGVYVGDDEETDPVRMATWMKWHNRYTFIDTCASIALPNRARLSYRDALTVAMFEFSMFFAGGHTKLRPFGAENILRHLGTEAPLSAVRSAVADIDDMKRKHMRVSGLEEYFVDLMREAGVLSTIPGLEAKHGEEPLMAMQSGESGQIILALKNQLSVEDGLAALRLEGNLNRFIDVYSLLKVNELSGYLPIEDTVTKAQAAQIDFDLIRNPALAITRRPEDTLLQAGTAHRNSVYPLVNYARSQAEMLRHVNPGPYDSPASTTHDADGSEWVYRRTLSRLMSDLPVPYRRDSSFRSNLSEGKAAIEFTAITSALMPQRRYDPASDSWVTLSDEERKSMASTYSLSMGMMFAALAFGADSHVREVALRIDSLGLEEAVRERASAMGSLLASLLGPHNAEPGAGDGSRTSRADPKDGDVHGPSAIPGEGDHMSADAASLADGMVAADTASPNISLAVGQQGNASQGFDVTVETATLLTVTFDRGRFLAKLKSMGFDDPMSFYRFFDAQMDPDAYGVLQPIDAQLNIRDLGFSPVGSQEVPEMSDVKFTPVMRRVLGCDDPTGLAIQREDLLQRAISDFHRLSSDDTLQSASKARHAMDIINGIGDPELTEASSQITSALIDGREIPNLSFRLGSELDEAKDKAVASLQAGDFDTFLATQDDAISRIDGIYSSIDGVPLYFNSYADRIVYNRIFAVPKERVVLIPDQLFRSHLELANFLMRVSGPEAAYPHMAKAVKYAPTYSTAHLMLTTYMAARSDWDSLYATALNGLRVSLAREDAAFAYCRIGYAEWMRDHFATAVACYLQSVSLFPNDDGVRQEMQQVIANAVSQNIHIPRNLNESIRTLHEANIPVWPDERLNGIICDAERVCVDNGLFIPAINLALAAARMNSGDGMRTGIADWCFRDSLEA